MEVATENTGNRGTQFDTGSDSRTMLKRKRHLPFDVNPLSLTGQPNPGHWRPCASTRTISAIGGGDSVHPRSLPVQALHRTKRPPTQDKVKTPKGLLPG